MLQNKIKLGTKFKKTHIILGRELNVLMSPTLFIYYLFKEY